MSELPLRYKVVSTRTGTILAAFAIRKDAHDYAIALEQREGPNGVVYEVKYV